MIRLIAYWTGALLAIISCTTYAEIPAVMSTAQAGLGEYRASEPLRFREAVRRSVYVPMRDGVRLAVDYYLPATSGHMPSGPFPVVVEYTRYGRARPTANGGTVRWDDAPADAHGRLQLPKQPTGPLLLLGYGYAIVVIDMRGAGASFGPSGEEGDAVEGRDGYDAIGWIAEQPWSDGNIGMMGGSYLGEIQPRVAAERPPALKALSMQVAFFDGPNGAYAMGGVYRAGWMGDWSSRVATSDNRSSQPAARITNIAAVDDDPEQVELRKAIEEHRRGGSAMTYMRYFKDFATFGVLRDRISFIDQYQSTGQNNLHTIVGRVNRSAVPTLLLGGWHDIYPNDMLYWFANLTVPRKLILGPYAHGSFGPMPDDPRDLEWRRIVARETLRWFDYWLRGIRNDAEDRSSIHYGLEHSRERTDWYTAASWPPATVTYLDLHLSAQVAGGVQSQNDGSLTLQPDPQSQRQPWTVDYRTTTGDIGTRWFLRKVYAIEMAGNDMKSMTYTSPPLYQELQAVGIPVVRLQLSSDNVPDADIYAYLTAVDPQGRSRLVSEGILRASHRTLGKAPYANFDLPFPTSNSADVAAAAPLSKTPVTLEFAMLAIGRIFHPGERIRLTISGADRGNTVTPEHDPAPHLALHLGGDGRALLRLPIHGNNASAAFAARDERY